MLHEVAYSRYFIHGIIQYLSLSLAYFIKHKVSKVHSFCIYKNSISLWLDNIPECVYVHFVHSCDDEHLDCCHPLTVVNNAAVSIDRHLFKSLFSVLFDIYLGVKFLGHMEVLCLTFGETAKLVFIAPSPFYIPTRDSGEFQFLHVLANACYFPLFLSHLRCKVNISLWFVIIIIIFAAEY